MGIPGLTSYITHRAENFSIDHELRNTNLVIDGNCVMCQLYTSTCIDCSYCYGGDYGEYAYYVSDFLDDLLKCKVIPIIIFDGGNEDKKMSTITIRLKGSILNSSISTPENDQRIMPLLTKDVFLYIAKQKNIKCLQTILEADDQIASIARILNCPVLSNDSDFFIYDVMYIPFYSLKNGIFPSLKGNGYVKHCKIFKIEYFLHHFAIIDKRVLPLSAALLGNDYIDINTFQNFFSTLKIQKTLKQKNFNKKNILRIEAVFGWIYKYTLDEAIARVIKKLPKKERQPVLEIIEMVINGYLNVSSTMLGPLGYSSEEISSLMEKVSHNQYKFTKPENLHLEEKSLTSDEVYLDWDEDVKRDHFSNIEYKYNSESEIEQELKKIVPSWFFHEYHTTKFPRYYIDMLNRQTIIAKGQKEDHSYPTCINVSLKILNVTFRLLSNGTTNINILKYIGRSGNTDVLTYELNCNNYKLPCEIPILEKLIDLPVIKRKEILVTTLGVSDKLMVEFPPPWRLYVAIIKYWMDEVEDIFATKYYLYSAVLIIIFHVIKKVIRCKSYFEKNNLQQNASQTSCKEDQCFPSINMTVKDALTKVVEEDCKASETFFKSKRVVDKKQFNITTVHAFSLLQNCLKYGMHFNALLGHPYPNINIAEYFNSGILAHNLYNDLKNYKKLNQRICEIFKNSSSILQLFVSTSTKIQAMIKRKI